MDDLAAVARVEEWHASIQATVNSVFNEEDAWYRYMNTGLPLPEGMHTMPARRRVAEYSALRGRCRELESL
ncbi:MAG: hypothetical protein A2133_09810 [Actinobacteria bacterium RBG_16_64_13]|nr:MAG: hypothetical protein A2133_09810 [Actinobacteria bacterium RBG_16_64_13]